MDYKFSAQSHGDRWMPMGVNAKGDEIWCDGCCIGEKGLAERIAMNMETAYKQGLEDGARKIVQAAIKIAAEGGGSIADSTCLGAWIVRKE